jgi:hypothetical protein
VSPRSWFHKRRREKLLVELVREEITWYWGTRFGRLSKAYLVLSSTLALVASIMVIYILLQPLVVYDGFTLSGYVSPLTYELRFVDRVATYPFLDSLNAISVFMLLFALTTSILGVLGVIGVYMEWRTWVAFVPASTASASLLISILYSLLRLASMDAIPTIPYTITVSSAGGGRIYLYPPKANYTWIYYLPWRPVYFFIAFNLLIALTAGSLVNLILKPKPPVTRARIRRKSEESSLNQLFNRLRGLSTRSRGGGV